MSDKQQIQIDAVAALFQRREAHERDEALRLAGQVRALTELCNRQTAAMQKQAAEITRLNGLMTPTAAPKPKKGN